MKELNQYVARKNEWNAMFKGRVYDLSITLDRQLIADALDADLSPENLTCDGELPRAQVIARKKFLDKAAEQMLKLDPTVKMYEFYTGE
jgi:hypothetical protein